MYRRDSRLNPSIQFPLKLQFDEIGVVKDKHSEDYVVGDKSNTIRSAFNTNIANSLAYNAKDTAQIHAILSRLNQEKPYRTFDSRKLKHEYGKSTSSRNNTKLYNACLSVGHCISYGLHKLCGKVGNTLLDAGVKASLIAYLEQKNTEAEPHASKVVRTTTKMELWEDDNQVELPSNYTKRGLYVDWCYN